VERRFPELAVVHQHDPLLGDPHHGLLETEHVLVVQVGAVALDRRG
jgi:hypothetical protein